MKNNQKKYTCCLCGGKFEGYGNNPYQLDETPYDRLKRLLKEYGF